MTNVDTAAIRAALASHDWPRAHELAAASPGEGTVEEAERLDLLAEAAWWLGRMQDCIDARQQAYQLFEQLGDSRRAGQCAVWLFEHHCLVAQPAIGNGWLRRARRALGDDTECTAYGALLLRDAECAHGSGEFDRAMEVAEQARSLARRLDCADLEAESLQTLGRVLIDSGDVAGGLSHLDEAMLFAVEGRLGAYSTGKVYCSLISACEELGDLRRAAEWTDATARWADQHPLAIFPGICRVHRAVVLDRRGALADAEREATRACTELAASHIPNAAAAFAEVGDIRRRLGDIPGAEAAFADAKRLSGHTFPAEALLLLAQGEVEAAQQVIEGCLASQPGSRPARAATLVVAVQVLVAAGMHEAAQACVEELDSLSMTCGSALFAAWAATARGRIRLATHDAESAVAALHDALPRWHELEVPYEVASTLTLLAQALRESGREDAALASFADAKSMFERIGAQLEPLNSLAGKAPRPSGLTEREVEVLRLIAGGESNREIAMHLSISPKTVSRHLSNIFTKINVSSRAAATAFAFEHHLMSRERL